MHHGLEMLAYSRCSKPCSRKEVEDASHRQTIYEAFIDAEPAR